VLAETRPALANASSVRMSSTSISTGNPFASVSASMQPSGEAASNSSARRRLGLGAAAGARSGHGAGGAEGDISGVEIPQRSSVLRCVSSHEARPIEN